MIPPTPNISKETFNFHFSKHYMGYFKKLTAVIEVDAFLQGKGFVKLVRSTSGGTLKTQLRSGITASIGTE